ncbi:Glycine-rich domain-containing protein 1 [Metarhizium anisopliae]|nr:Glycine-rich domain-containing protein 1 [Metarhizium anisopliae]
MPPRWSSRYKIPPKSKNCVRKMMSRYWENFSPFALDLCGAVMRQGVFVDKMVKLDWLHSPSARETMARLIDKYVKFMELMRRHPKQIAVPTLDVDLAWHTHQLIPPSYYADTTRATSKFIDHDDKIEEVKLNQAFEWTSKTYQVLFQEFFRTMNSADAEYSFGVAIRASHTSSLNSFLGTSKGDKYAQDFYQSGRAGRCPPDNSAHISAHNAVRSADASRGPVSAYLRSRQEESLERNYQKAVKRAEKKGRTLPPRNDYYDHWGYSYFMYPLYLAPGMYYGWDPCYVYTGAGAWGGCAAGSCGGGGVAAGACGNAGGCGAVTRAAGLEREVVAAQEAAEEDRDREAAEVAEEEEDVEEEEEAAAADVEEEVYLLHLDTKYCKAVLISEMLLPFLWTGHNSYRLVKPVGLGMTPRAAPTGPQ